MNDEEIKAIEYINKMLEYPKLYAHTGNESDFLRGIDKKQMETVLNLIEKQKQQISNLETAGQALEKVYKAEIEKQKERIEYLERSISRKEHSLVEEEQDNVELKTKLQEKDKSLKLHTKLEYQYKNDYLNVIEDLKKKDKIIDLAINKVDHIDKCMICTNENCHECNSCIKEYFENKVKESK